MISTLLMSLFSLFCDLLAILRTCNLSSPTKTKSRNDIPKDDEPFYRTWIYWHLQPPSTTFVLKAVPTLWWHLYWNYLVLRGPLSGFSGLIRRLLPVWP